ncbi:HPr family phosphocarrier protein [Shewanella marina]|uniref:HPr family phosphocarrier protein n=1 Tax=Shewanella marina TaxID=487319 RepID=UPI00046F2E41|nr:HPr family phosphocarrier protein [Shewanella marina]
MPTYKQTVTIANKLGLHARAATKLALLASEFDAEITLSQGDKQAQAASVLGLLMLESCMGKSLDITATGTDAKAALAAICNLINAKFDEPN